MANKKISELTAKGATIAANDLIEISEYVAPNTYTSKKITGAELGVLDTFLELTDTPNTFTGNSLKVARVNAGETALEFATVSAGATAFTGLSDVPASYSGQALKFVRVNAGATALEFATVSVSDTNIANSNLTVSATGTRKLIFAGAVSTDIVAFRNSTDTSTMFQVSGDGVTFANILAVSSLPFTPTTNYAIEIRNRVTNAGGFPIAKFTTQNGIFTALDIYNDGVGVGTSAVPARSLTVRAIGGNTYTPFINGQNSGGTGVFAVTDANKVGIGSTAYNRVTIIGTASTAAWLNIDAGVTGNAQINLASGVAPTTPQDGDIWYDGTDLKMRIGGVTKTFTLV